MALSQASATSQMVESEANDDRGPLWLKSSAVIALLLAIPILKYQLRMIERDRIEAARAASLREDPAASVNVNQETFEQIKAHDLIYLTTSLFGNPGREIAGPAWPNRLSEVPRSELLIPFRARFTAQPGFVPIVHVHREPSSEIYWLFWRDALEASRWIAVAFERRGHRFENLFVVAKRKGGF